MNAKNKVLWLALCVGCLMSGIAHAADATKMMSLDDCTAVLEKLKTDGTIKQYKLNPGENGMLKLDLSYSGIIDLKPLKGMRLEWLHIDGSDHDPSKVATLAGLEGMPLKELSLLGNTALEDISAIKGAPLKVFKVIGTHGGNPKVADLGPLEGMALEVVVLGVAAKDVNVLKGMPLKAVQLSGPVTDISGLKGLQLKSLSLHGANQLVDLSPLQGMPLESIDLFGVIATDLSPLSGMPLKHLDVPQPVSDLSTLKDMPALESLSLAASKVTDFSPLKTMKKLKTLSMADYRASGVSNIATLAGMLLESLDLANTRVTDIGPVKDLPNLKSLSIQGLPISTIEALKGSKLTTLNIAATKVTDIAALKGVPLTELYLFKTEVTDLTPLAGSPLKCLIAFNCPNLQDLKPLEQCKELEALTLPAKHGDIEFLRKMPKLKHLSAAPRSESWWIYQQSAEAFWTKYDAEKQKTP